MNLGEQVLTGNAREMWRHFSSGLTESAFLVLPPTFGGAVRNFGAPLGAESSRADVQSHGLNFLRAACAGVTIAEYVIAAYCHSAPFSHR